MNSAFIIAAIIIVISSNVVNSTSFTKQGRNGQQNGAKRSEPERLEEVNSIGGNLEYEVTDPHNRVKQIMEISSRGSNPWKSSMSLARKKRDSGCGAEPLPKGMSSSEADTYTWLDYDPNGIKENLLSVWSFEAVAIHWIYYDSLFDARGLTGGVLTTINGQGKAVHHALWMYRVVKKYDSETAKAYGDAKERSRVGLISERTRNLYNNKVGRCLATDSSLNDKKDSDVILDALNDGKLLTTLNEPENKQPCKDISGNCRYTKDCDGGKYVSGKCPNLPNDIKCCLTSSNEIENEMECKVMCGYCKMSYDCSGKVLLGKCPKAAKNVRCCVPTDATEPSAGLCDVPSDGGEEDIPCDGSSETGSVSTRQFDCISHHIRSEEGLRCYAYDAQPSNPEVVDLTIGYGFNLKRPNARDDFNKTLPGVNFDKVYARETGITSEQAYRLLRSDLPEYIKRARSLFNSFDNYRLDVKIALVDGVYRGEYKETHTTVSLINNGTWDEAAIAYVDRNDYKTAKEKGIPGIVDRMDANAEVMKQYGKDLDNGVFTEDGETC